jgi:hypothetical protein
MDRLEVPLVGARLCINGNNRVTEQVRAFAIASVRAADRRSERQVKNAALWAGRFAG